MKDQTKKQQWEKIFFNAQNIIANTETGVLIKMPNSSHKYKGYSFWMPQKLVRVQGGRGYHMSFSFTSEFTFKLKKYGRGRYNWKDVIAETEIGVDEMKKAFGVVDENVNLFVEQETDALIEKEIADETVTVEVKHHVPERVSLKKDGPAPELLK